MNTYLGSNPQTDPDIRPPGPDSPEDHFFHVDIVFWNMQYTYFNNYTTTLNTWLNVLIFDVIFFYLRTHVPYLRY